MSELREEQEMEAEALEAIFMESFKVVKDSQPFRWSVRLAPVDCGGDAVEDEKENHVVVNLLAEIPLDYPESSPPELDVEIVRGLAEEQRRQILDLAKEEAEANAGMAAIFTVCEAVREWLGENNIKGQDDGSMYAQMIWKQNEAEKAKAKQEEEFESQKASDEMTEAEQVEIAVRKRREEGTPCNDENFAIWKKKFDEEMAAKAAEEEALAEIEVASGARKKAKGKGEEVDVTRGRLTGYDQFSGKLGIMNLEAIEKAAEEAEGGAGDNLDELDEDLFDEDDSDLDDLDFDSDEDLDSDALDDEDDEPDI